MASLWSTWIIVLTVITFVGLVWVLFSNRKREKTLNERTTGHVYDGIEEYDNPLPAWWFYMFVMTIVWGIAYLVIYPGMGNFKGTLGWTQIEQHEREVAAAESKYRAMRDKYLAMPIEEIIQDPAARKMGLRMFSNNCSQCHGADAAGSYGFPNLTDDDWIYGGTPEAIKASIVNGRMAAMPAWGDIIGEDGVRDVTAHIMSLNGREADAASAAAGSKVFGQFCIACHGADATGNQLLGAPNLVNGIWLYGGTAEQISHTVRAGRNGQMPAHKGLLSEDKIHLITAYIYGLSH